MPYNLTNLRCAITCRFEPTFSLNRDSYIDRLMSGLISLEEGRCLSAVAHLALLGVNKVGTASWGTCNYCRVFLMASSCHAGSKP